jgi:hypothetical protein
MADTLTGTAPEAADAAPEFPMPRQSRCPFDPPPALKELQEHGPLTKVRLWDGSEPWLVTFPHSLKGNAVAFGAVGWLSRCADIPSGAAGAGSFDSVVSA